MLLQPHLKVSSYPPQPLIDWLWQHNVARYHPRSRQRVGYGLMQSQYKGGIKMPGAFMAWARFGRPFAAWMRESTIRVGIRVRPIVTTIGIRPIVTIDSAARWL